MNIALIGYRGTGKSAVSKRLAVATGKKAVSLDEEISTQADMSIPQIVDTRGWSGFRDLEQAVTAQYSAMDDLVIDCGGGVILRKENVVALKSNATLVWLKASPEIITQRIATSTERPALVDGKTFLEEIEEVLAARTPLYEDASDFSVDTDALSPEEITEVILSKLHPHS
ncbi:MAG: shikimate kinase [Deltaproteobacteria bacterium]|nr:shikimate kinase [Deltaproteobacteria bacterium]